MLEVRGTGGDDEETAAKEVNKRLEWLGHLSDTRIPNHKVPNQPNQVIGWLPQIINLR